MSITAQIQSLTPGTIVDMYEIDASIYGITEVLRYSPHANEMGLDIKWQGNTYYRLPITVEGFKRTIKGTLARPKLTITNIGGEFKGLFSGFLRLNNDLLGSKVTRRRTLARYLDATNFVGGVNPYASPDSHFPDEVYYVDRKEGESRDSIVMELAVSWDVIGVMLPSRQVIRDTCQWIYRGADCGYVGPAVARIDDSLLDPTIGNLQFDQCSKRMTGCKLRFGSTAVLPASFYPLVGLIR